MKGVSESIEDDVTEKTENYAYGGLQNIDH